MGPYLVTCASRAWFHLIVFGLLLHLDAITSSSRAARLPWADASTGELRRVDPPPCTAGRCGPWEGTEELDWSSELAVMSGGSGFG